MPRNGPPFGSIRGSIALLNKEVKMTFKDQSFSKSKRTKDDTDADDDETSPSKRSKGGNTGHGPRRGEHVYHDHQVVDAFTRAGYTLESNDEDENGWAPLNQVKQPCTLSIDLN
jgi:hypothetical protein